MAASRIQILGKTPDANGTLFTAQQSNSQTDLNLRVGGAEHIWVGAGGTKHELLTLCDAPTPIDRTRTQLGVGEVVGLYFYPPIYVGSTLANLIWLRSAGSVDPQVSYYTKFTAPSNETPMVTVSAKLGPTKIKRRFSVVEPSGIKATVRDGQAEFFSPPYPRVAAGMYLDVFLQPTTVSFYRVEMMEPGADATGAYGYFEDNAFPHNNGNGADKWHPVDYNNKILSPPNNFFDHAWLSSPSSALGQSGGFTWPIDAIWRVGAGDTTTDALNGWTPQVVTLSSGTMTIEKLGRTVVRQPNEPRGTAQ